MTDAADPPGRWPNLWRLGFASLLAMSLWFSATAVVPQLDALYRLDDGQRAWLTMSVQIGFVVGALISAVLNLADRFAAHRLFAACALLGAFVNAAITLVDPGTAGGFNAVLGLRFVTGLLLAGVYPPGMKLMASWFRVQRGLALGVLIGALSVGSAAPHLLAVLVTDPETWRSVLLLSSVSSLVGAVVVAAGVRPGPLLQTAQKFHWAHAAAIVRDAAVRRANFGYLGHMWELYAMWTWAPLCIIESYRQAALSPAAAKVAAFGVVAVGGVGCIVAGRLADRSGRTLIASAALAISGACALVTGFAFDHPLLLTVLCLIWGIAVVADSAQFSSAVSELCDPRYVGTVLTMQTCSGFLLTVITIRLLTPLKDAHGWGVAFAVLAAGPVFGIASMLRLRRMPEATKMANGRR